MEFMNTILAVSPRPAGEGSQSLFWTFFPMILIFVVFYFLLIAPARKKQKKHAEMLDNLKTGDKVITNGGIHGTVVGVSEQLIQLRIAEKIKIDISKQAVAAFQSPND